MIWRENWQGYDWLFNFFSVASDTFCHAIVKTFIKAAVTINLRNCPKSLKSAHWKWRKNACVGKTLNNLVGQTYLNLTRILDAMFSHHPRLALPYIRIALMLDCKPFHNLWKRASRVIDSYCLQQWSMVVSSFRLASLWSLLSVLAVVNVGVSGLATKLTLECVAHNCGYTREDVGGKCPPDSVWVVFFPIERVQEWDLWHQLRKRERDRERA